MTKRIVIEKRSVKNAHIAALFSAFAALLVLFLAVAQFATMFNKSAIAQVERTFQEGHNSIQEGLNFAESMPTSIPNPAELIEFATSSAEKDIQHERVEQVILDQVAKEVISTNE
jgi:hypothetical protein